MHLSKGMVNQLIAYVMFFFLYKSKTNDSIFFQFVSKCRVSYVCGKCLCLAGWQFFSSHFFCELNVPSYRRSAAYISILKICSMTFVDDKFFLYVQFKIFREIEINNSNVRYC